MLHCHFKRSREVIRLNVLKMRSRLWSILSIVEGLDLTTICVYD
mgnify:CR=1 FL=1